MQFLDTSVYRGPNVYALFPVIRHTVDLGALQELPTARLGGDFLDFLIAALSTHSDHVCSLTVTRVSVRRLL